MCNEIDRNPNTSFSCVLLYDMEDFFFSLLFFHCPPSFKILTAVANID